MVYKLKQSKVPGIRIKIKKGALKERTIWKENRKNDIFGFYDKERGISALGQKSITFIGSLLLHKKEPKFLILGAGTGNMDEEIMTVAKKINKKPNIVSVSLTNPFPTKREKLILYNELCIKKRKDLINKHNSANISDSTKQLLQTKIEVLTKQILLNSLKIRKSVHTRKKELKETGIQWINSPLEKLKYARNKKFDCIISSFGALTYSSIKTKLFYQQLKLLAPQGKLIILDRSWVQLNLLEIKGFNKEEIDSNTVIYTRLE